MRILAVETSCDETGAAVVEKVDDIVKVHSNITATSIALHAETGGIIPENAAREQIKAIIPVIIKSLLESEKINEESTEENFKMANKILTEKIDAIAITHGPGLIGSLLVGVETAKALSFALNKPIVPVNHLLAHLFANAIDKKLTFPFIGLIVSGGHTDLLLYEDVSNSKWLGGTRDDAAGEAFDKIGRLLNLPYPAGPEIERRANEVKTTSVKFKSPLANSDEFDFSFSGLKTEVLRFVEKNTINETVKNEICFAVQKAIIDVLVKKTLLAQEKYGVDNIVLGGGVSANETLRRAFGEKVNLIAPERKYSTDNAAMIGAYALLDYKPAPWGDITANPDLYFS